MDSIKNVKKREQGHFKASLPFFNLWRKAYGKFFNNFKSNTFMQG